MSQVRVSTGTLPNPPELERLATSRPFIEHIDVVFPSRIAPDHAFMSLGTTYSTAQWTLSELYTYASNHASTDGSFKAIPMQSDADDTWCIDPRGVLTLSVSKALYEQLGIVGKKLPFKGCPERYVIDVPLKRGATTVGMQARQRAALAIWDRTREAAGLGRWQVACTGTGAPAPQPTPTTNDVTPRARHDADVHIPRVGALTPSAGEPPEAHLERLEALFEWVGMACLGAQRLRANDRVDPYVAVYEPPTPSSIGDVTHLRWKGLLDGAFVRSVIETAISTLASSSGDDAFIGITLHSNLMAPVSYIPQSLTKEAPARVPGLEAEDTVCVMLSRLEDGSTWGIGQSISKWDARWG